MSTKWIEKNRGLEHVDEARFNGRIFTWKHRLDPVMAFWLLILILFFAAVWSTGVISARRAGIFDPPPIQPLVDPRILSNIKGRPLLDAVSHLPDGSVYFSQQGGAVHRYRTSPELWSTHQPKVDLIDPNLTILRSGCGNNPDYEGTDCPDPDSLWAVSADQGLVRRYKGQWQTVISDTRFVGHREQPVEHDQLTVAAVSDDGEWLVLGSKQDGPGFYHLPTRHWLAPDSQFTKSLPSLKVRHIAWWKNRFLIGGPGGLFAVEVGLNGPSIQARPRLSGQILDLDIDDHDHLWVLLHTVCDDGKAGCKRLLELSDSGDSGKAHIDERNLYPDLDLSTMQFARFLDNHLFVAAETGVYSYNTISHGWSRHFDQPVLTTLALPDGSGFYFGYGGGVGLVKQAKAETWVDQPLLHWRIQGARIHELRFGARGEVLALAESGALFALGLEGIRVREPVVTDVYQATRTQMDPKAFTTAQAFGDTVLFLGKEGALLHDTKKRGYLDIPKRKLPNWLLKPKLQLVNSDKQTFAVSDNGLIRVLDQEKAAIGVFANAKKVASLSKPLRHARAWANQGLGLLDGQGIAQRVTNTAQAMMGPPHPELNGLDFDDVALHNGSLAAVSQRGLHHYDPKKRDWGSVKKTKNNDRLRELVSFKGHLLTRTEDKRLLDARFDELIGGSQAFPFTDKSLSDVFYMSDKGGNIFLAGARHITRYDLGKRRITKTWTLPESQARDVFIETVVAGKPLSLYNGIAYNGRDAIEARAGRVVNLSYTQGLITTVREGKNGRYLANYTIDRTGVGKGDCFFRNPVAISVKSVFDAVDLGGERLALATDRGLYFYHSHRRSWYASNWTGTYARGRLFKMDGYLVFAGDRKKLGMVKVASISLPDSCSQKTVKLPPLVEINAYAVDAKNDRIAYVKPDGSVEEGPTGSRLLGPPGKGPDPLTLVRVYGRHSDRDGYLLFTAKETKDSPSLARVIWRYHLKNRRWSQISITHGGESIVNINLVAVGKDERVLARTVNGHFYKGSFTSEDGTALKLSSCFTKKKKVFGSNGKNLLDVQQRDDKYWTFVLDERVKYYDPVGRRWQDDAKIPEGKGAHRFYEIGERGVIVANNNKSWWVAAKAGPHPKAFIHYLRDDQEQTGITTDGTLWRLMNGRFSISNAPEQPNYPNFWKTEQPFLLEPKRVLRAFEWKTKVIFDSVDGLRLFNTSSRGEWSPGEQAGDFGHIDETLEDGDTLLLRSGQDLLELPDSRPLKSKRYQNVSGLTRDDTGRIWACFDNAWSFRSGNTWNPFPLGGGKRPFVINGAQTTAMNARRKTWWWKDQALLADSVPLPRRFSSVEIKALLRGRNRDWWVLLDDHVEHLVPDQCANPKYVAPVVDGATSSDNGPVEPAGPIEPKTLPCYKRKKSFQFGPKFDADNLIYAAVNPDEVIITDRNNRQLRIAKRLFGGSAISERTRKPPLKGRLEDHWSTLKSRVVKIPDGRTAYDPVTSLALDAEGYLIAKRPSLTVTRSTEPGTLSFTLDHLPNALDEDWLKWRRGKQPFFKVRSGSGRRSIDITPVDFSDGTRLLFEEADAILADGTSGFRLANRHGIWSHPDDSLALNKTGIRFQPVNWSRPKGAAHGRFLVGGNHYSPGGARIQAPLPINFGEVTLTETGNEISSSMRRSGSSAFGQHGFSWDNNKKGLAYGTKELLLQSDAGLHALDHYFDCEQVPMEGWLYASEPGKLFFTDDQTWRKKGSEGWDPSTDPRVNHPELDNGTWIWILENGRPKISFKGTIFKGTAAPAGYGFHADKLVDAELHGVVLVTMTGAFLEKRTGPNWVTRFLGPAPGSPGTLENIRYLDPKDSSSYKYELVHRDRSSTAIWNVTQNKFGPLLDAYHRDRRLLATSDRLRFYRQGSTIEKQLKIEDLSDKSAWSIFSLSKNRFPFDRVTSLAVLESRLYVGTDAGLQVFRGTSLGLDQLDHLYGMGGADGKAESVTRVGVPVGKQAVVIARSKKMVIEGGGANFVQCKDESLLDKRLRLQTALWRWFDNEGLKFQYRDKTRGYINNGGSIKKGYFPHDQLSDMAALGKQSFSLWSDGWISVFPNTDLSIKGARHFDMRAYKPSRFAVIVRALPLVNKTIEPGIYFEDRGESKQRRFWRYLVAKDKWQPVVETEVNSGLADWVDKRPVLYKKRLRLLHTDDGFLFQARMLNGDWLALDWHPEGCLAIDRWYHFLPLKSSLWAVTSPGLISFSRVAGAEVFLDTDDFTIVREPRSRPKPGVEAVVAIISDLKERNGTVFVRCSGDSHQVYKGVLDKKKDTNVFEVEAGKDPFVAEVMVPRTENGFWNWSLQERAGGKPGRLVAWLGQENLTMAGGRFTGPDTLAGLAFLLPGHTNLITNGGGWYQATDFALSSYRRPKIQGLSPESVTSLHLTRFKGEEMLALGQGEGFQRLDRRGLYEHIDDAPEYYTRDRFWHYLGGKEGLLIKPNPELKSAARRHLASGRFNDDRVTGPPITGKDEAGTYYLVPTTAGVCRLDIRLRQTLIHVGEFIPLDSMPSVLLFKQGEPLYLAPGGFYHLQERRAHAELVGQLPNGLKILAAELDRSGDATLTGESPTGRSRILFPKTGQNFISNNQSIWLRGFHKFESRRVEWGTPDLPWLDLHKSGNSLIANRRNAPGKFHFPLPDNLDLITSIHIGERLLLVGSNKIYAVDLNHLVIHAFDLAAQ